MEGVLETARGVEGWEWEGKGDRVGAAGEAGRGRPGQQRGWRPSAEEKPVLPLPGAPAPGGQRLLCQPALEADRNVAQLPQEEGPHTTLLLCPGRPGGGGVHHHGGYLVGLLWALATSSVL